MKKQMVYFFTIMIYLGDLQSDLQSDTLLVRIFPKAAVNEKTNPLWFLKLEVSTFVFIKF